MSKVSPNRQRRHTSWRLWKADCRCVCRKEAKTDPCATPFFRRRSLLGLLSPVDRVKLLFRISSMIIRTMCLSGRSLSSCRRGQSARQCHKQLPDQQTSHRPAFFASKVSSMFCVSKTTRSTVDFPCRNPACFLSARGRLLVRHNCRSVVRGSSRDTEQRDGMVALWVLYEF